MQYVAAVCGKGLEVDKVKEQLLQSNPVLEGKYPYFPSNVWGTLYNVIDIGPNTLFSFVPSLWKCQNIKK